MAHAEHAAGDGKTVLRDRYGVIVYIVIAGEQLNGKAHGGTAFCVPAHVGHCKVLVADKFDVTAAAVEKNKIRFRDQPAATAGQGCQLIDRLSAPPFGIMAGGKIGHEVPSQFPGGQDYRFRTGLEVEQFAVGGAEISQQHAYCPPVEFCCTPESSRKASILARALEPALTSQSRYRALGCWSARCLASAVLAQKDWAKNTVGTSGL